MSDFVNEGDVRVSITSPSPSRPPLPPSRNLPPAGTTPHVPSNLPVLTASDSPDEFGDEGIEDEGKLVGTVVGIELGTVVGIEVGKEVGLAIGSYVGTVVGFAAGIADG